MDLNLKQWRCQQQYESGLQQLPPAKLPRFLDLQLQEQQHSSASSALPLFVPDSTSSARFPKMGSYFSLAQWQELELQALIFRHMLAGAAVPPELLHLLKKTIFNTPSSSNFYLQHYPHCHPALFQSGYWGRGSMDPEPGRCRRTDGKKWRCSRDVVAGHKYCERHMHRGRNRSRKPVEPLKPNTTQPPLGGPGGGLTRTGSQTPTPFDLSGSSPSIDLLHLNPRSTDSRTETRGPLEAQTEVPGSVQPNSRVLRQFFDDKPVASSTSLSISTPGNPASDFSLKLSTGNGDGPGLGEGNAGRDRAQVNWAGAWGPGPGPGPHVGGPLGEALRSSASNSSPTSVLHQLPPRGSTSETSFVST